MKIGLDTDGKLFDFDENSRMCSELLLEMAFHLRRRNNHLGQQYSLTRSRSNSPFPRPRRLIWSLTLVLPLLVTPAEAWAVLGGTHSYTGVCAQNDSDGNLACGDAAAAGYGNNDSAIGNSSLAAGQNSTAIGYFSNANGQQNTTTGGNSTAVGNENAAYGNGSHADGTDNTALGANSTVHSNVTNSVAIGAGSLATNSYQISVGNAITGMTRQIANVAAGTSPNDAVNYSQLSPVITQQSTDEQKISSNTSAIGALGTQQTTDKNNISSLQSGQKTDQSNINSLQGQQTKDVSHISSLQTQQSTDEQNIASNTSAIGKLGTQQTTDESNIGSLQSGQKTDQSNISSLQGQQNKDVSNISSLQTQQSTDEQNIASNATTINAVVDGKAGVCTISDGALECSPDSTKPAAASGNGAIAEGMNAKANGMGTIAEGMNASAQYSGSVAIGNGAQANADPTTAIGNNAVANGNNSTAVGANTTANGNNSVALGQGSVANRANSVSVGNAATGMTRQITNVAPGTEPNDAVNLGQLQEGLSSANETAQHYADTVGAVDAAALNAAAAAATGRGPNNLAGGVGEYNGQSAFAFTYEHRFNRNWSGLITVGSNGDGNNTEVGGGANFSW